MSTIPTGRGRRVLRFLLFSLLATAACVVITLISSRIATESLSRGIESSRATGLSSYLQVGIAPSFGEDLQVVRAGSLMLGTRDFDAVRVTLNSVVEQHQGRLDEVEITASPDSGRRLTAIIRIPAEEFDPTFGQLKTLGVAEQESQTEARSSAAESDRLEAKLVSARFTEDRLDRLTREHTGKLGEYLEVEQEIAKIRGEIEDLQAQQRRRTQRVQYAVIRIDIKEEFAERFDLKRAVISARLHSAIVGGLQGVVRQGAGVLSILLRVGPSLLFWLALLYWPVRSSWRRIRALLAAQTLANPSVTT